MYLIVVAALALTALTIWIECLAAFRSRNPPRHPSAPYPAAPAIVAAYLPNEAETIVETVEAFLAQDYEERPLRGAPRSRRHPSSRS